MTTTTPTIDELRMSLFDILLTIAPDAAFDALDATDNLREELDIDSFDFLNFVIGVSERTGVDIPEADYGRLVSLDDVVNYIAARLP